MAEQTVPIDNADMWQSAMAPEPPAAPPEQPEAQPEPAPQVTEDESGRLRGADGRFVAKQETTDAPPTQEKPAEQPSQTQDEAAQVPSWRLRELREERDAAAKRFEELQSQSYADRQQLSDLQRQLAELRQPKQEPIDFFQNPDGALQQRLSPIEQQFQSVTSRLIQRASMAEAIATHGKKTVDEMRAALTAAVRERHPDIPALERQMDASDDPVGLAMNWYQRDKLQKETGGDLTAYKNKLREELLKDPEFQKQVLETARGQAQAPNGQAPPVRLPPSLNKATGTGASEGSGDAGDDSDQATWKHATAGMRRR